MTTEPNISTESSGTEFSLKKKKRQGVGGRWGGGIYSVQKITQRQSSISGSL